MLPRAHREFSGPRESLCGTTIAFPRGMTHRLIARCRPPAAAPAPGSALHRLVSNLERCGGVIPPDQLRSVIESNSVGLDDVRDFLCVDASTYSRNRVVRTDRYEVLVFCWCSGQRSTIHDHEGSACGVRVVCGAATEIVFERVPGGDRVRAVRTRRAGAGQVTSSFDTDIHQIANDDPAAVLLVTLHVYSPPLDEMNVYEAAPAKGAAA